MATRKTLQFISVFFFLAPSGLAESGKNSPCLAFVANGRLSSRQAMPSCRSHQQQHKRHRLYVSGGSNDKNGAAGASGGGNNKDRLDEIYYQRFMGGGVPLNDEGISDDAVVAAEIADIDPSTIDSLRIVEEKPSAKTLGGGSSFLNSVRKAAPSFASSGGEMDMMMSGPKVYIIPQNQGEAPLEVRSIAPGQRQKRFGVIAEVAGRSIPKRPGRVDLGTKMAQVKQSIKDAPTRLTEMQVQNLRNGGVANPRQPPQSNSSPNKDQFTFPSFPAPAQNQQQSNQAALGSRDGRRASRKKGMTNNPDNKVSQMSRDWRTWIGVIAAISFLMALINAVSYRSELVVLNDIVKQVGAHGEQLFA